MGGRRLRATGPQNFQLATGGVPAFTDRLGLDLGEAAGADVADGGHAVGFGQSRGTNISHRGAGVCAWTGGAAPCDVVAQPAWPRRLGR